MAEQKDDIGDLGLFKRLEKDFRADQAHSSKWRTQAKEDFDFIAGHGQWSAEERAYLESSSGGRRLPITFNYTSTMLRAIAGIEIGGRHETVFLPRGTQPGAVKKNELLTAASDWMDGESDAPKKQSRAFRDAVACGMGWTEASLAYDEELDGKYAEPRISPLEMYWDSKAREDNLADARRVWHARASIPIAEARAMFPDADDAELHCPWVGDEAAEAKPREEVLKREENSTAEERETVTILRCQWWELEPVYRVAQDPITGQQDMQMSAEQWKGYQQIATDAGLDPKSIKNVKQSRRVYKQAFIGNKVLEVEALKCPHFTFNAITGESDDNAGTWFGLVSIIREPQKWANKWLTQGLHILNTTAKGGILAERDAFADQQQAEESYARPDAITWMTEGAIQKQKLMPKPGGAMPTGYLELMQHAVDAIRQTTGINMELLGLRDANQPGVLEAQRKQAGMTILGTLFDSLRQFRKNVGRVRLYYIQEYLADGRLIRVTNPQGMQYVPLAKDKVSGRFDVIVDEAPSSTNEKERAWGIITQILPVFKDMITPEAALLLLEYSPLPSRVVEQLKELAQKPNPEAEKQAQLAEAAAVADIEKKQADTEKTKVDATATLVKTGLEVARANDPPPMQRIPASGTRGAPLAPNGSGNRG